MENMHTDVGVERAEPLPFMFLKYQFIESVFVYSLRFGKLVYGKRRSSVVWHKSELLQKQISAVENFTRSK